MEEKISATKGKKTQGMFSILLNNLSDKVGTWQVAVEEVEASQQEEVLSFLTLHQDLSQEMLKSPDKVNLKNKLLIRKQLQLKDAKR